MKTAIIVHPFIALVSSCILCVSCISEPPKVERLRLRALAEADYDRRLSAWPVACRTRYIPTRYGQTHAIVSGPEGAPVIMLFHAMGLNALTYAPNVAALSARFNVYAIDTIGDMGRSVVRRDYPENGREYADWVADIVKAAGTERAVLVGCSMGGWIVSSAGAYRPECVERLILISPAAGIPERTTWGSMLSSIIFDRNEANLRELAIHILGQGAAARDWTGYFMAAAKQAGSEKLGFPSTMGDGDVRLITAPTLLLIGDGEVVYADPQEVMDRARRLLARVETVFIPKAGHLGHYDNPEFVNNAIVDFLR